MSHWWGEPVLDFIKCLKEHARVRELGEDATYWVCAYANNQHELGQDIGTDPRDSSFYQALQLCEGVLVVLDAKATPFTRIWCASMRLPESSPKTPKITLEGRDSVVFLHRFIVFLHCFLFFIITACQDSFYVFSRLQLNWIRFSRFEEATAVTPK